MNKLEAFKQTVSSHPVLKHSFLTRFERGQFNKTQVKVWFEQQFYLSTSLSSAFAALFARLPNNLLQQKRLLADLINVETWGSDNKESHSTYYLEVADYLEIDTQELAKRKPRKYTSEYINIRLDLCQNPAISVTSGLAAIALANEFLNLYLFKIYKTGISEFLELKNCPTSYFDVHLRDEKADFQIFHNLYETVCDEMSCCPKNKDKAAAEALRYVVQLLDARAVFLDALLRDLNIVPIKFCFEDFK